MTTSCVWRSVGQRKVGSSSAIFASCIGDFLLIAARFGRDRQAEHRRRESQRAQMHAVQRMIIVQHVVGVDLLDLGHRADVAGDDLIRLAMFLALQMEDVAELDRLFVVPDVHLRLARSIFPDARGRPPACRRTDRSSP